MDINYIILNLILIIVAKIELNHKFIDSYSSFINPVDFKDAVFFLNR